MAISKPTFNHKVYWKSELEYEQVKQRARQLGLENNISAYIRDCVKADMRRSGWEELFNQQRVQQEQQQKKMVPFEGKLVTPDEIPQDLDLSLNEEEDMESLAKKAGLFDDEEE
jgi:hypothetical protein